MVRKFSVVSHFLVPGLLSIFVTFMVVMTEDFSQNTFFQGYNRLTAVIIMFQVRQFHVISLFRTECIYLTVPTVYLH